MEQVLFELKITDDLSLVLPHPDSIHEIFTLIDGDREYLRTWLPWVDSTITPDDTLLNLLQRIADFHDRKKASFYGTLKGEVVASVGFVSLQGDEGEIGYWLLSSFTGKGLMTSFVRACIEYGFEELNLQTIIIKCAEGNLKSAAIPKRLGFTLSEREEPMRLRNGCERKTLVFELKKSDWYK